MMDFVVGFKQEQREAENSNSVTREKQEKVMKISKISMAMIVALVVAGGLAAGVVIMCTLNVNVSEPIKGLLQEQTGQATSTNDSVGVIEIGTNSTMGTSEQPAPSKKTWRDMIITTDQSFLNELPQGMVIDQRISFPVDGANSRQNGLVTMSASLASSTPLAPLWVKMNGATNYQQNIEVVDSWSVVGGSNIITLVYFYPAATNSSSQLQSSTNMAVQALQSLAGGRLIPPVTLGTVDRKCKVDGTTYTYNWVQWRLYIPSALASEFYRVRATFPVGPPTNSPPLQTILAVQ